MNDDMINNERVRQLIIDAMVALIESGVMSDEDYRIINALGIIEIVEEKAFVRAGDTEGDTHVFPTLAWER